MELKTEEVLNGQHNSKTVWICDYRWTDFDKKEDRNIKPTKVLIRSTDETSKRVNYSTSFFSEIKNDKVSNSSLIKLFDNTGYRWYSGIALHVFTEEEECKKFYKKQAQVILKDFEKYKENKILRLDEISNKLFMLV